MVIQFFFLLAVVMKQDTVDAVISHNTVISEDSTSWIFLSSLYQVLPVMSNSLATVGLCCLPSPHPVFVKVTIASQKRQNRWSLKLLLEGTACLVPWKPYSGNWLCARPHLAELRARTFL